MASWVTGMAIPVVSGQVVVMNAAKKSTKAKPKKEEGKNFLEQLGEWTQKSSLNETDPLLKKVTEEKKGSPVTGPAEERKKSLFGL